MRQESGGGASADEVILTPGRETPGWHDAFHV